MEVIAIIVIGGLLAGFLGRGRERTEHTEVTQTKSNNDWMRHQHLVNEHRERERAEADQRRRN